MKKYAYGVDIGGTTVKMGFFETTGKLVDTWEIPTRTENSGELILPDIAASIKENNEKHGIEMGDIEGVGMGVPGPVKDDGTVLKMCQPRLGRVQRGTVTLSAVRRHQGKGRKRCQRSCTR